jgi:Right handed beta helix region
MTKTKHHMMVLMVMALVGLLGLGCWAQSAPATVSVSVSVYPAGQTFSTIQEAIDSADAYDTIVINEGTYHENLVIEQPLTLIGLGDVLIGPVDRTLPAILIDETDGVVIHNIGIEAANVGIEVSQSSARIVGCHFQTSETGVDFVGGMGVFAVIIEDCVFRGERIGVRAGGDGSLEIAQCEFKGLGYGTFLSGLIFVTIYDCLFELCDQGVMLSSTVSATLIGNRMENTYVYGIQVAAIPFDAPLVPLVLVANVIRNSTQWGISFCTRTYPFELTFKGEVKGYGNIIEGGHGYGPLCPTDYEWPEGLFSEVEDR